MIFLRYKKSSINTDGHRVRMIRFLWFREQSSKFSSCCVCVFVQLYDSGLFTEITGFCSPLVVIWVTTLGRRRLKHTHTSLITPRQSHPHTCIRANGHRWVSAWITHHYKLFHCYCHTTIKLIWSVGLINMHAHTHNSFLIPSEPSTYSALLRHQVKSASKAEISF